MKYTVAWLPAAEQELADLWLAAEDRTAVTQSAALLDRQLANEPDALGESRPDGRRVHFAAPQRAPRGADFCFTLAFPAADVYSVRTCQGHN